MVFSKHGQGGLLIVDESMIESIDEDSAFSETTNAFGPAEFANALSQNLNIHGTNAQKLLGKHGLLSKYRRIAQEKFSSIVLPN